MNNLEIWVICFQYLQCSCVSTNSSSVDVLKLEDIQIKYPGTAQGSNAASINGFFKDYHLDKKRLEYDIYNYDDDNGEASRSSSSEETDTSDSSIKFNKIKNRQRPEDMEFSEFDTDANTKAIPAASSSRGKGPADAGSGWHAMSPTLGRSEGGSGQSGFCSNECTTALYTYIAIMFVGVLITSPSSVANIVVKLRCVKKDEKPLALGFCGFVFSLLAFIPAPIVMGSLIDKACIYWSYNSCGERGACWMYNNQTLRYYVFGANAIARAISFPLYMCAYWKCPGPHRSPSPQKNIKPTIANAVLVD